MRILLTAGPTREPIDAVRYIGNRSSGRMGAALADAALRAGHSLTLVLGPVAVPFPDPATTSADCLRRLDVETAAEMQAAVLREFPSHDLLIMAAAVADYRPKTTHPGKIGRHGSLALELEATEDIIAAAGSIKRPDQRTVGFSLEARADIDRARQKMLRKKLDLMVFNPTETMNSPTIEATLLYPDGRSEPLPSRPKADFADVLLRCAMALF